MWQIPADAPCLEADPDLFQPERIKPELILAPSLDYCRFCSDRSGCLAEGMRMKGWGIWGGMGLVEGKLARQPSKKAIAEYLREQLREKVA